MQHVENVKVCTAQVYDSGSDMEDHTAAILPHIFNSNADATRTLQETVDTRSDNKVGSYSPFYKR